jgi:hypothetical protein
MKYDIQNNDYESSLLPFGTIVKYRDNAADKSFLGGVLSRVEFIDGQYVVEVAPGLKVCNQDETKI